MSGPTMRKARQQRTRSTLLSSAGRVLARQGLAAPIEEVTASAGLTKGAFYANFKSKEELFLAMLEERFAERLAHLQRLSATDAQLAEQVRAAGEDFAQHLAADPEWQRLFFEFALHATREESFRERLTARYRDLRSGIAAVMERRQQRLKRDSPVDLQRLSMMLFAMANGFALERLLEPEAATEETYSLMLAIFFAGLRAIGEEGAPGGTPERSALQRAVAPQQGSAGRAAAGSAGDPHSR